MIVSRERTRMTNSHEVAAKLKELLAKEDDISRDREHFWVISLNTRNVSLLIELVGIGTVNACFIHPREIFRRAIVNGAAAIILGHSHPSGESKPSDEDISLTRRLREGSEVLGIKILDHVIVGEESFSFLDSGMM